MWLGPNKRLSRALVAPYAKKISKLEFLQVVLHTARETESLACIERNVNWATPVTDSDFFNR